MRKIFFWIFFLGLLLFSSTPSFAVSVNITNYPSIITEESFTITASVSGATAGTNYLRIDLYKDGLTSYFGETFNNVDWYAGSVHSQYLPITIQSGIAWEGTVSARVGNPTISQYDGTGAYKMRLRRYTSGGGYTSSEANNGAVSVSINLPTPTPTPTPTSTPASSSTSTPTPTPTATQTSTPTPSPTISPIPTKIVVGFEEESLNSSEILGTASAQPSPQKSIKPQVKKPGENENIFQKVFIILGILTIITSVGIFVRQKWIKQ